MGGRSGQSIRTVQRTSDDIARDINRERRIIQDLNERLDNATTDEEEDKILKQLEEARGRIRNLVNENGELVREQQRQQLEREQQQRQEIQRQQQEIQRQLDEERQRDAETYKDYNASVNTDGTNRFPQYSTGDMISFTGIPKDFGGSIRVSYNSTGAEINIYGEGVNMTRNVYFDSNGNPDRVYNAYFRIDNGSQHDGRGSEIFNNQVQTLKSSGFNRIEVTAAGSAADNSVYNGYYTWARFGYVPNNPTLGVNEYNRYADQQGYERVSNFKEIMYTKAGRDWWQNKEGVSFRGTFNLQDNSYSMTTLNNYMQERANRNRNR